MRIQLLIIVHLLKQNRKVRASSASVNESRAGRVDARDIVEKCLRQHGIWQAAVIDKKPDVLLLKDV